MSGFGMDEPLPDLSGRSALVTGGGRGIGAAVAETLARAGAAVAVAARTPREVEEVAAHLRADGHRALALRCDVTREEEVASALAAAEGELGPVDILVNNAGVAASNPLKRITLEEWNRMFSVNATGPFLATRAVLPGMLERGWGRVVTVASVAGLAGARYIAAYTASKHAAVGFVRAVAAEVEGTGVTVNALCPGYVDTPLTEATLARIMERTGRSREEAVADLLRGSGQPRLLTPEEVARGVAALCAPEAAHLNGLAIPMDGRRDDMSFDAVNPPALGAPRGWTHGLLAPSGGRVLLVAGQDAAEPEGGVDTDDFVEQFARALQKAILVVRQAGGRPQDIGRLTIYVTDMDEYRQARPALKGPYRALMGRHFPAMALVQVAGLVDPRARVEIEATAVLPPLPAP